MTVLLQFALLGLIQGLTEFLPVSSSGHLVLLSSFFGLQESLFVSILLHVATLLSIFVVMRKEILCLVRKPFSKESQKLLISTLVTFLIVLLIYDFAKNSYFESYVPFFFMITACLLILTDLLAPKNIQPRELTTKQSVIMGIAQGLAIFPGISRSGATICAGIFSKGDKEKVAKQSFLMSIPIILASLVMEIIELAGTGGNLAIPVVPMIASFIVAFVVGAFSLRFMIKLTCKIKFRYFAYYLIILSLISIFI